jgi:hypothetical protein
MSATTYYKQSKAGEVYREQNPAPCDFVYSDDDQMYISTDGNTYEPKAVIGNYNLKTVNCKKNHCRKPYWAIVSVPAELKLQYPVRPKPVVSWAVDLAHKAARAAADAHRVAITSGKSEERIAELLVRRTAAEEAYAAVKPQKETAKAKRKREEGEQQVEALKLAKKARKAAEADYTKLAKKFKKAKITVEQCQEFVRLSKRFSA